MPAARPSIRRLTPLVLGVVLLHLVCIEWLARHGPGPSLITPMAEPEFHQALIPSAPASPAPSAETHMPSPPLSTVGQVVQARTLVATTAPAGSAAQVHHTPAPTALPKPDPLPPHTAAPAAPGLAIPGDATPHLEDPPGAPLQDPPVAVIPVTHREPEISTKNTEEKPDSTQNSIEKSATDIESIDTAWLNQWPASTRLNYLLRGQFRGEFEGLARVQWQRSADRYQAQVDVNVALLVSMRMTSQGRITPDQLWPQTYEEERRGKKRGARFGEQLLQLDNGTTLPRPPHLQDAASQFVQLAQDFASGRHPLAVGASVPMTLGRPGGVDEWVYDVVSQDVLATPLGDLTTYHLQPRPQAHLKGKVSMEMWFAPALQHMPVRIKLTLSDEIWMDLNLQSVAQSP